MGRDKIYHQCVNASARKTIDPLIGSLEAQGLAIEYVKKREEGQSGYTLALKRGVFEISEFEQKVKYAVDAIPNEVVEILGHSRPGVYMLGIGDTKVLVIR